MTGTGSGGLRIGDPNSVDSNRLPPTVLPPQAPLPAFLPDLKSLALPYDLYTDDDLAHRVLYVEASRGCPFSCEFCLSSLDIPVRQFPLDAFLASMDRLLARGARQFKFVDRTFNLSLDTSRAILRFFRERWRADLFLHFEMIPDRLPIPLRDEIAWFPPGALQFEIGIQSFDPDVCRRISRRQDPVRTAENFQFLRSHTGVHLHADLIVGLPGESVDTFAAGFDRLVALDPQEIQVGILKRLRGTPIGRHDAEWDMRYSPLPPYEILENRLLDFPTMQRLRRFARYWDMVANSGRFRVTLPLIWTGDRDAHAVSPFRRFLAFSDWLYSVTRQTHAFALDRLAGFLFRWLTSEAGVPTATAATSLADDWRHGGHRDLPEWLAAHAPEPARQRLAKLASPRASRPRRQTRHLHSHAPSPAPHPV